MAAASDALKRLGGGRWQTRDGRFSIEPQSGSWVVVDGDQTDDLGLPLVRGPYASLGAAKEAIEAARTGDSPVSPLAGRIEASKDRPTPPPRTPTRGPARRGPPTVVTAPSAAPTRRLPAGPVARPPRPDAPPPPPPTPPPPPPTVVDVLGARIEALLTGGSASEPTSEAIVALVLEGHDRASGLRWRLVDGDGTPVAARAPRRTTRR